jgi:hypothetical protein
MAAGSLLPHAVDELSALPPNAHERVVADRILLRFQRTLGQKPIQTREEQEFLMAMYRTWEDAREEGRELGRRQALAEAHASALLTVLRARGVPVSGAGRERILDEKDPDRLERWLKRAAVADSLAVVLDERRRVATRGTAPARRRSEPPPTPRRSPGRETRPR